MPVREIKNYFYAILAKRDYTTGQLADKGLKKGFPGSEVKQVIRELVSEGLVDDLRLARNIVDHYRTQKGVVWIGQKLKHLKVPNDIIHDVLAKVAIQPDANLKRKVEIKYKITDWSQIDPKIKQKILNYLVRQGFPNPVQILRDWTKPG
jgi:SOS response regulatory protein OraA/RecX